MASIITNWKNGTRAIAVVVSDKRPYIRLGKVSKKQAESAKSFIEDLAACRLTGTAPRNTTAEWLVSLPDTIRRRVEKAGLVGRQERVDMPTLAGWIEKYLSLRQDVKPGTMTNFQQVRDLLFEYFPADKPLDELTHGDAEDFGLWLRTERKPNEGIGLKHRKRKLAEGTVRRHLKRCKQFFAAAIKRKVLTENPFDGIKTSNYSANRFYFVSREEAESILQTCPDAQWRLIFALARFGGLRVPSEIMPLRWGDVNWGKSRFTVHSPKTEHIDGKGTRIVPMFPELLPYLRDAFEQAEPGTVHVITRYRHSNINLRTQLLRIIGRAGLNPWPKLFQNLRSTRETELVERFPVHVVTAWLGNSPDVARKHYLQLTDAHFERAVGEAHQNPHQNPHQQTAAPSRTESQGIPDSERNSKEAEALCGSVQSGATPCEHMQKYKSDPKGI